MIASNGAFLLKLFCFSFTDNISIFVYYGKTRKRSELNTGLGSQSMVGAVNVVGLTHPGLYTKTFFNAVWKYTQGAQLRIFLVRWGSVHIDWKPNVAFLTYKK